MLKRTGSVCIVLALIAAAGLGYAFLGVKMGIGLPCVIYEITGFYCPGCGVSRMCLSLLEGEVYRAFRYNPLLFSLLPLFAAYGIRQIICYIKGIKWQTSRFESHLTIILVVLFAVYGLLRNIPFFSYLAPLS